MTQKKLGYVELEWTCLNCGSKNPGSQKTCQSCGSPQPTKVSFQQAAQQELITDAQKMEAASKGPDIHCPYCGTRNPADAKICSQCGGDLTSGERRVTGTVVGAYSSEAKPVKMITCPNCATPNPDNLATCTACGALLHEPTATIDQPASPGAPKVKTPSNRLWIGLAVLAGLAVICLIGYLVMLGTRQQNLTGTVEQVNWSRVVFIQQLQDVTRSGWQEDIPAGAVLSACESRQHHTQDQPALGSLEVCGTPYIQDTGSGYGEVVQDCQYIVYQDYCTYTVQDWVNIEPLTLQGADLAPAWPSLSLDSDQRAGARQESYTIVFATDEGAYTYTTNTPEEFARFKPGSEWTLVLNGFNQIVELSPR